MDTLTAYHQSQDLFEQTLAALPSAAYPEPSRCAGWTVADVVAHVSWGQDLVRHLAERREYTDRGGAPGTPHPAERLAGADPLLAWRTARAAADARLTAETVQGPPPPALAKNPGATLGSFLEILTFDFLMHAWDIGDPFGRTPRVPSELLDLVEPLAQRVVSRRPGFFGPELTAPAGADRLSALLAFTGRVSRTAATA